jgi:transketolase
MRKWDLFEQYQAQDARFQEIKQRYDAQVEAARQRINEEQAKLKALILEELDKGVDNTKKKEAQRQAIREAEKALEFAQEEQREAFAYISSQMGNRIRVVDLVHDWNTNYRRAVREEELAPIVKRMEKARAEYLAAFEDFKKLVEEYRPLFAEVNRLARTGEGARQEDGSTIVPVEITNGRDIPKFHV